jgi:5-methylcytosine-specific restriction endonuclease McrA
MSAVLFLDHDYLPLRVESWQRAICDLFLGKVEVIEYSRDRTIQGVDRKHPMPSVVRVLRRFRRDRIRIRFSRVNIYARDRFVCQYDGRRYPTEDLTFDHVLPRSRGGRTSWENIVTCCVDCNTRKGNRTPQEAGMRLRAEPLRPRYLPVVTVRFMDRASIPAEWRSYWSAALEE